jgi:GNAT superfamily N-acetyltransferase
MRSSRSRKPNARAGSGDAPWAARRVEVHPVTPERWRDLERLFGERGACGGCWCMWWRLSRPEFERSKGAGNKRALEALVESGKVPGLLAYVDGEPAGWCALGPRESYPRLVRSRILKPVDEEPVWSVVCFFVDRPHRRRGMTVRLLRAAADHARERGASILEGYPVDPKGPELPDAFVWTGLAAAFRAAGFEEVARRSETRPVMRLALGRARSRGRAARVRGQ